jgi:ribosome-associated translation inhibitor RaiA
MTPPVQIAYGAVNQSDALDALIEKEGAKLHRFFDRIVSCRVVIDKPHRHHLRGAPLYVRIEIGVPGEELVVSHTPEARHTLAEDGSAQIEKASEEDPVYRDAPLAIRDAFRKARRLLQDYADRKTRR